MSSGAHEEYLDADSATDEGFIYYLTERAWNIEEMIADYLIKYELDHLTVYDDINVFVNVFRDVYFGMIGETSGTRLTNDEVREIYQYVKYEKASNYTGLTNFELNRCFRTDSTDIYEKEKECLGNNIERRSALHWRMYLADSADCDAQWLINDAAADDDLTLVNFDCGYDNVFGEVTASTSAYNTYLNGFVLEGDKKKKEIVSFKMFLKNYVPVTSSTNKLTLQNAFYSDLISDTIHTHDKNNVISRLAATKRWKRRVVHKLPPFS